MSSRDANATRLRILEHARDQFARHGYTAVTVKGVADAAGVSPNLITRYFGGKDGLFLAAGHVEIPVERSFDGDRSALGARLAASIVERWFGMPGHDPLLVLQRASGERPEAAETLASFLDRNSLEPLYGYLRDGGLDEATARARAAAIDAFVLGVSTRRRVLRSELGDPAELQAWLGATIQLLADVWPPRTGDAVVPCQRGRKTES
jgi:AcrR family transcriptional regulator